MARGDRLEVDRRFVGSALRYVHHGVDLGDGTVVHARPRDFRWPFGGGSVVRTSIAEFADGEELRTTLDPPAAFPPEEIAARALSQVGRDGYCPVVSNCEHFATWCATDEPRSRQVEAVVRRVAAVTATVVAGVVSLRGGRGAARAAATLLAVRQGRR